MDLVIPLNVKDKSKTLRYALRTAWEHLEFDELWIVGIQPNWLKEARELRVIDSSLRPHENIKKKFQAVIDCDEISDEFMWGADDIFLTKDYGKRVPYYHRGKIKEQLTTGDYWGESVELLQDFFPWGYFFELHFPIVLSKQKLQKLFDTLGVDRVVEPAWRSFYCNFFDVEGEYHDKRKFNERGKLSTDGDFFSVGNDISIEVLADTLMDYERSPYEKPSFKTKITDTEEI